MITWLAWPIAVASSAVCVYLWFKDVRRIMRDRKSTVESAAGQLAACRAKMCRAQGDLEAEAVLKRSESIYRQAVELYNETIHRKWIFGPAMLMGFRPVS